MKLLLLGATGSLGRHLAAQALSRGYEVTALVRNPLKLPVSDPHPRLIVGDALNPATLNEAVQGQDAVIFSLGRPDHRKPTTLFSDATRILIRAMETHGVRRLVCVTGIGAGDSKGHGGFLYDRIVLPLITRETYIDKDLQEELIRASSLDWVIVRPESFTNGPLHGNLRAVTDLRGVTIRSISRADAAAFVLDQLAGSRYLRQSPLIGY
ncbi:MAG: NAD(P)-dependent oxidoreductase [Candidatus Acidiferrales bacterium]